MSLNKRNQTYYRLMFLRAIDIPVGYEKKRQVMEIRRDFTIDWIRVIAILLIYNRGSPSEVVTNLLDCDTVISEFNLPQCNYVRFLTNSLEKKLTRKGTMADLKL